VRSSVPRVRCVECAAEQASVGQCISCGISFGAYFCGTCRLYRQADASGIFHCDKCGICRVGLGTGPGGSHWHCASCVACLPNSLSREAHKKVCLPEAMKGDCPICFEDLHGSRDPCVPGANCGHYLHDKCRRRYFQSGKVSCPMCAKPLVELPPLSQVVRNAPAAAARGFFRIILDGAAINQHHPLFEVRSLEFCYLTLSLPCSFFRFPDTNCLFYVARAT